MPMFEDSGVSYANAPAQALPEYDGGNIETWERLCAQRINVMSDRQLEEAAAEETKVRTMQDIADETFSRLMKIGTDKSNGAEVQVEALTGAWCVFADFARLSNGQ